MTRLVAIALLMAAALGCGDDQAAQKNNGANNGADAANNGTDAANNGADAANNGADAGNNGADAANNGADAGNNGTPDTGGDAGTDAASDAGTDAGDTGTAECLNGILEPGEECDDGNSSEDDACLNNCRHACGDGVVNASEQCDTGIAAGMAGACPTACDDGDVCTTDTLVGMGCQATCMAGDITACANGDGCCATGCNSTNDDDCVPACGNGVVESGERCDGNCAATCDDGNSCTTDVMSGTPATCDVQCANNAITACTDGDGCCAPGCNPGNDSDCSSTCGDGVVDAGETCDGNCPTGCDDGNVCTTDSSTGSAAACDFQCSNATITVCDLNASDGCCPAACSQATDVDCGQVCGNGAVEAPEECDDGGTVDGDGCDSNCMNEPVAFRLSDLDLKDPHIYVDLPFFGCRDLTNNSPLAALAPPINAQLQDAIQCDGDCGDAGDDDGLLDLSYLMIFRPLLQGDGNTAQVDVVDADCTAPMAGTSCTVPMASVPAVATYSVDTNATCLDVLAGTASPANYTPVVDASTPPCFVTAEFTLNIDVAGITIPLQGVQGAATFVGNPASSLQNGLLRGFLSEADAENVLVPIGANDVALSSLLPGGSEGTGTNCNNNNQCGNNETCQGGECRVQNCAGHDDRDVGPDGTTVGWWFYLNFPADRVILQ